MFPISSKTFLYTKKNEGFRWVKWFFFSKSDKTKKRRKKTREKCAFNERKNICWKKEDIQKAERKKTFCHYYDVARTVLFTQTLSLTPFAQLNSDFVYSISMLINGSIFDVGWCVSLPRWNVCFSSKQIVTTTYTIWHPCIKLFLSWLFTH